MGIYVQPIVQGTNCHVEFNLFYDPDDAGRSAGRAGAGHRRHPAAHERRRVLLAALRRSGPDDHEPGCGSSRRPEEVQGDRRSGRHPQSRQTLLLREGRQDASGRLSGRYGVLLPLLGLQVHPPGEDHRPGALLRLPQHPALQLPLLLGRGPHGLRPRARCTGGWSTRPRPAEVVYNCNLCGACDVSCKYAMELDVLEPLYAVREECVKSGQTLPVWDKLVEGMAKGAPTLLKPRRKRGRWASGLDVKDPIKEKAGGPLPRRLPGAATDEASGRVAARRRLAAQEGRRRRGASPGTRSSAAAAGPTRWATGTRRSSRPSSTWPASRSRAPTEIVTGCAHCYQYFKVLYPKLGWTRPEGHAHHRVSGRPCRGRASSNPRSLST